MNLGILIIALAPKSTGRCTELLLQQPGFISSKFPIPQFSHFLKFYLLSTLLQSQREKLILPLRLVLAYFINGYTIHSFLCFRHLAGAQLCYFDFPFPSSSHITLFQSFITNRGCLTLYFMKTSLNCLLPFLSNFVQHPRTLLFLLPCCFG